MSLNASDYGHKERPDKMGPVSRGATVEFQREMTASLRQIVRELRETRELINNRMGGNALDHETLNQRIDAVENRVYFLENERPRPAG